MLKEVSIKRGMKVKSKRSYGLYSHMSILRKSSVNKVDHSKLKQLILDVVPKVLKKVQQ